MTNAPHVIRESASTASDNSMDSNATQIPNVIDDGGVAPWSANNSIPSNYYDNPFNNTDGAAVATSVDTASLSSFVTYIETVLIPKATHMKTSLGDVNIQPGAFADADNMRNKINGSDGLAGEYSLVFDQLIDGLTSMQNSLSALSTTYADTEDLNNLSASDLQNDLYNATQYFNNVLTDAGGSGTGTTSTGSNT